jgi:hypothetical protein
MTGFSNPIIGGGGSLVYPSIHSPNFVKGSAGWTINKDGSAEFNNLTIRNGTIVSGLALYYSGTPAAGNLIASIAAAAGTDSFGNAYLGQVASYQPASGVACQMAGTVIQFYTGPVSGAGPWTASASFGANLIDHNATITSGTSAVDISTSTGLFSLLPERLTTGWPQIQDTLGLTMLICASQLAGVGGTTITTTALTSLGFKSIPGNEVEAGTSFPFRGSGSFSTGGVAPASAIFFLYWGGIGGTIIGSLAVPAAGLWINAAGQGYIVEGEVNWIDAATAEVSMELRWRTAAGVGASVTWHSVIKTAGLSTSGAQNLSMAFQWGANPGTLISDITRIGKAA